MMLGEKNHVFSNSFLRFLSARFPAWLYYPDTYPCYRCLFFFSWNKNSQGFYMFWDSFLTIFTVNICPKNLDRKLIALTCSLSVLRCPILIHCASDTCENWGHDDGDEKGPYLTRWYMRYHPPSSPFHIANAHGNVIVDMHNSRHILSADDI